MGCAELPTSAQSWPVGPTLSPRYSARLPFNPIALGRVSFILPLRGRTVIEIGRRLQRSSRLPMLRNASGCGGAVAPEQAAPQTQSDRRPHRGSTGPAGHQTEGHSPGK